jgi:tetratricopeptide (TPR) repeat protein
VTSDYVRAYTHIDRSLVLAQSIQPRTKDERLAVATAINALMVNRGDALWYDRDDKQGALVAYRASLEALDRSEFVNDIRVIKMQVFGAANLASTLFELGQKQEALRVSRAGIELAKRMRIFDDSIRALQLESTVHGEYSLELYALGNIKEADAEVKTTLDIRRELRRRMPGSYESQRPIPVALRPVGEALDELGQKARACDISNFDKINEIDWLKKRMGGCR